MCACLPACVFCLLVSVAGGLSSTVGQLCQALSKRHKATCVHQGLSCHQTLIASNKDSDFKNQRSQQKNTKKKKKKECCFYPWSCIFHSPPPLFNKLEPGDVEFDFFLRPAFPIHVGLPKSVISLLQSFFVKVVKERERERDSLETWGGGDGL